jgi:hypothetical protein
MFCGERVAHDEDLVQLTAYAHDFEHPQWHFDPHSYGAHATCLNRRLHRSLRWEEKRRYQ